MPVHHILCQHGNGIPAPRLGDQPAGLPAHTLKKMRCLIAGDKEGVSQRFAQIVEKLLSR
ncbi:MAG: hypothetical protein WD823_13025 [Sulfuricaulis sp.]|uniref:hypothetical protein n=1 Tax=Sulfuricaulis sp. TaxID=2003553 RepID=UPI0034A165C5